MLQKIKDLMRAKEEIDAISRNIAENSRIVSELKDELSSLKKEVVETKKYQDEFNAKGQEVLDVIRIYENRLCSTTEGGGYGKYSGKLADKFHEIIKINFPRIASIGLQN